jgi:FkbM family methyltransferase
MNLSGIPYKSWIGKILRFPLRLIPPRIKIPILQGKLRGKTWIVGAGKHGYWLGSYEYKERILFEKTVTKGSIVFDIGAHCGFYTLLASELVGPEGRVFAFEPVARNIYYLKEHLRLNNVSNVDIIEAAVSDICAKGAFDFGSDHFQGKLMSKGSIEVKTVALDDLIERNELPIPDYLKIDVEGSEIAVLMTLPPKTGQFTS